MRSGKLSRMRINSTPTHDHSQSLFSNPKKMRGGTGILLVLVMVSVFIIGSENEKINSIQESRSWDRSSLVPSGDNDNRGLLLDQIDYTMAMARVSTAPHHAPLQNNSPSQPQKMTTRPHALQNHSQSVMTMKKYEANPYALSPGELPGYTGWARPEQTLAGYFDITPVRASLSQKKYHSVTKSGDIFSILLTCNHNRTSKVVDDDDETGSEEIVDEPPYECPPTGGALFYVRAYGPSVITGTVTDFQNSSYSVELKFVDPGEYTLEVVLTFSVPMEFHEFPLDENDMAAVEPGYEGYLVAGFPLSILVEESLLASKSSDNREGKRKPWCTLSQLTESSPASALYKGRWRVVDHVARSSHQPLTSDETDVSIDGYRMGLNSIGVRMTYEYEECELIHIRDLVGVIHGGMDSCLKSLVGFKFHDDRGENRVIDDNLHDSDNNSVGGAIIAVNDTRRQLALLGGNYSGKDIMNETNVVVESRIKQWGVSSTTNTTANEIRGGLAGRRDYTNGNGTSTKYVAIDRNNSNPDVDRASNNDSGEITTTKNRPINMARASADKIQHVTNIIGDDYFEGIHVIFIGDSVMKLVMSFFYKLVERTTTIKVTFIETNGGIRNTINNVTSSLVEIQQREKFRNVKRAILFNSGLHDIDVMCSSKRLRSRRTRNVIKDGESCEDAYREAMTEFIHVLDKYPAELKIFRSTTAGQYQMR